MSKVIDNINDINAVDTHISIPASYHIYNGNLALASTVSTNGFSTTLYTGNGSTQSINTGVDMSTQWGNDSSETYGGLVWCKGRSVNYDNYLFDTIRGASKRVLTSQTVAETADTGVSSFNTNGYSLGSSIGMNQSAATYASWNFQTTHRTSGTTNHGKAYTCHYNPYTGFTMVQYVGSGIAGHEIPHMLGRKLGFANVKNLTTNINWHTFGTSLDGHLKINLTSSIDTTKVVVLDDNYCSMATNSEINTVSNTYILYGWANSYFDEANTLIGNYEVGVYQGTGASGNKVVTRGKPAWVMIKRLDSTGNWQTVDNIRGDYSLFANLSQAETSEDMIDIASDGFIFKTTNVGWNASGGQYLYMVVYDNDNGSGKTKYPKPSDSPVLNLNATVPLANGIDGNGSKVSLKVLNETVSGVTLTQGKNYVYRTDTGYGVSKFAPQYGSYNGFGDYFDLNTNKWYSGVSVFSDSCDTAANWTNLSGTYNSMVYSGTTASLNNSLVLSTTTNQYAGAYKQISTIIGKKYKLYCQASSSNGYAILIGSAISTQDNGIGLSDISFTASSSTTYITLLCQNYSNAKATFDNIAVYPINNDGTPDISNATAITARNYLDAIVYADTTGNVEYVEQLPKTTYFDEIKANDYKGKNACTAWVNFDGTTTPPTIRDSYNVSSIIKVGSATFDIYFTTPMDNVNYTISTNTDVANYNTGIATGNQYGAINGAIKYNNKIRYISMHGNANDNTIDIGDRYSNEIQIFGGKNS